VDILMGFNLRQAEKIRREEDHNMRKKPGNPTVGRM
jgi:hypothetical protein